MVAKRNLVLEDMEKFLRQYTRFLSKDIYIDYYRYEAFMNQYFYLFQEFDRLQLLYQKHAFYEKIMQIRKQGRELVRHHNLKYLKAHEGEVKNFFHGFYEDVLSFDQKRLIFSGERQVCYVSSRKGIPLVVSKVRYLLEIARMKREKVVVLTDNKENCTLLKKELALWSFGDVLVDDFSHYLKKGLHDTEKLLSSSLKYSFFRDYLMKVLYLDKKDFQAVSASFSEYFHFNQDYLDFDTFRDYHAYLYKRMYLESQLSMKKFLAREILQRKKSYRTIQNEKMASFEEVDLANFFYLNEVPYQYCHENHTFVLDRGIRVILGSHEERREEDSFSPDIYLRLDLEKRKKWLEVVTCRLINLRYPLSKRSDEEIYRKLRETTEDSYFVEFITKILIPLTENSWDGGRLGLTKDQEKVLEKIRMAYQEYLQKNHLVEESVLRGRVLTTLFASYFPCFYHVSDLSYRHFYFSILEKDTEDVLFQNEIKVFFDYKNYLLSHQWLLFRDAYLSCRELSCLRNAFLRENVDLINEKIRTFDRKISVFFYEEGSSLSTSFHLTNLMREILLENGEDDVLIGLSRGEEVDYFRRNSVFSVGGNHRVCCEGKSYFYGELFSIKKNYSVILLPFLFSSLYGELRMDFYSKKLLLLMALMRCRRSVFVLCPRSCKREVERLLRGCSEVLYV